MFTSTGEKTSTDPKDLHMCLSPEEFLSFDQSLLLISWPSCCAYRLSQRKKDGRKKVKASGEKWAARLLQACALLPLGQ